MADLVVPALGESITEAVVSVWLKQVGDAVAADEPVAELETDKVTVQLPSPVAGVLAAQAVAVGATVRVGDVIGSVQPGAAKAEVKTAAKPETPAQPVAAAAPAPAAAVPVAAAASAAAATSTAAPAARPAAAPPSAAPAQVVASAAAPARPGNGDGLDK